MNAIHRRPACCSKNTTMTKKTGRTLELEFLGTGTSIGIPVPSCRCPVCMSSDSRDTRWRSSVLIRNGRRNLVVDAGPEFRLQCLRAGIDSLAALVLTHDHADHLNGLDDLRAFTLPLRGRRRGMDRTVAVYGGRQTMAAIRKRFDYIWNATQVGGGLPQIEMHTVKEYKAFVAAGLEMTAIPIKHGAKDIFGYRVGGLAYLTDISALPDASRSLVENLDVLVLSCALRRPHETHFSLKDIIRLHARLQPRLTLLTHISHYFGHRELLGELPSAIRPAHDGLRVEFRAS